MNDIKAIVAKNIAELRVKNKMTQLDFAEKLNYSDKAISKWEHGDSLPDISVLVRIAELFGVTMDYLVSENHQSHNSSFEVEKPHKYNRAVITLISLIGVWALALFIFVLVSLIVPNVSNVWLCFIYAIPVTVIVWLVLNSIWANPKRNYLIISVLMWSILLSLHISFSILNLNIWMIYLLGIPGQIIILLCSFIRKKAKH